MSLDNFIEKFNGFTEPYWFYDGSVELRYDPKEHIYYRIIEGEFVPQDGVTTVVHIIDKSDALIPWGCKMMATKLLATTPISVTPLGEKVVPQQTYEDYEKLVLDSKNAHREKLEEAANVGHEAHAWIEGHIKACLGLDIHKAFPEDQRAANCCTAALSWMTKHNVRWRCTERKIYSRFHEYAGTMDGLALVDSCDEPLCCPHPFKDRLSLIDWKTSNYLYLEYLLQTAAYEFAYEEETREDVVDRWIIRLGKEDAEFDPWHLEADQFAEDYAAFTCALDLHRAVNDLKDRIKGHKDAVRAEKKARAKAEKEEMLKIKCKNADRYKGVRPPQCNDGNPCQVCLSKYAARQAEKSVENSQDGR